MNSDDVVNVPLSKGLFAFVDKELDGLINQHKWHATDKGYAARHYWVDDCRKILLMHRFIWEYVHGPIPDRLEIDHKNGIRSDNRLSNLRAVSRRKNTLNKTIHREGKCSSRFAGVSWSKSHKKWKAGIHINGKSYVLGYFSSEEEASSTYQLVLASYSETGSIPVEYEDRTRKGAKGYYWNKANQKWHATISIDGKRHFLGCFNSEEEASQAYRSRLASLEKKKGGWDR